MTNLRELARGKDCRVRLPGICNGNPETTVLAHIRNGFYGMGSKPSDLCAVFACSDCHDAIDRRKHQTKVTRDQINEAVLRGHCEQLELYVKAGIVTW